MNNDSILFKPQSIFFHINSKYSKYKDQTYYVNMFLEDLHNSIMPIGGKRITQKQFSVSISPNDQQIKNKINILFPSGFHPKSPISTNIEEIVSDFIGDCATNLVAQGTQYYEIVPASLSPDIVDKGITLPEPIFILEKISGKVLKLGNIFFQFIPKNLWNKVNKKFVIIPGNSVWQVSFPKKISGMKSVEELLKGLFIAGGKHLAEMKIFDENLSQKTPFDVASYYRNAELYVAWLTKSWGWDLRSSLQRYSLEYYQLHRSIVFAYNLAIFREHIFEAMNSLLSKIDYKCQMNMSGLPSSSDFSDMISKLETKEISINEVYDLTNIN